MALASVRDQERLRCPWYALNEQVTARQKCNQRIVDGGILAHHARGDG
jgi:hypothetical protein